MKKNVFVIDLSGNTRDLHTLKPVEVTDPIKPLRDSITAFMLMNSIKVIIFDYPDCLVTFRYRKCDKLFPFAVTIDPYNKTL